MENSIQISVIIPAHNCAETLSKAVNSVPDNERIEVLIVENGSTDNTIAVARQLVAERKNVKLLKSDRGVSAARNQGVVASHGTKILFLDADDYYCQNLLSVVKDDLSSSDLDIYSFESGAETKSLFKADKLFTGTQMRQLMGKMLDFPTSYLTVWGKVFNGRIIRDYQILFPTDLRLSEDSVFLLNYLTYCRSIGGHSELLYHYSRNQNSTVRTFNREVVENYTQSLQSAKEVIFQQMPFLRSHYYKYGLMQLNLIGVHGIFTPQNPASFSSKVGFLKRLTRQQIYEECLQRVPLTDLKSLKFIAIVMIKLKLFSIAGGIFWARNHVS